MDHTKIRNCRHERQRARGQEKKVRDPRPHVVTRTPGRQRKHILGDCVADESVGSLPSRWMATTRSPQRKPEGPAAAAITPSCQSGVAKKTTAAIAGAAARTEAADALVNATPTTGKAAPALHLQNNGITVALGARTKSVACQEMTEKVVFNELEKQMKERRLKLSAGLGYTFRTGHPLVGG